MVEIENSHVPTDIIPAKFTASVSELEASNQDYKRKLAVRFEGVQPYSGNRLWDLMNVVAPEISKDVFDARVDHFVGTSPFTFDRTFGNAHKRHFREKWDVILRERKSFAAAMPFPQPIRSVQKVRNTGLVPVLILEQDTDTGKLGFDFTPHDIDVATDEGFNETVPSLVTAGLFVAALTPDVTFAPSQSYHGPVDADARPKPAAVMTMGPLQATLLPLLAHEKLCEGPFIQQIMSQTS